MTTSSQSRPRAESLAERILQGDRLAAARAITLVEDAARDWPELMRRLAPSVGRASRVGITGPPGAGKSTLVDALAREMRARGETVGIVAVDPTSPFSGGAFLGDRVRMSRAAEDPDVFVRSMASRGSLGGLARTAQETVDILDALGKTQIFLETVGVGQAELAVAAAADTTVVVLVPESGGTMQAMKAGLMEIADVFVVNKADRPGYQEMVKQLQESVALSARRQGWEPPVLTTVAPDGKGVPELADALGQRVAWLQEGGRLDEKRREQSRHRIRELVRARLEEHLWEDPVIRGELDVAARRLQAGEAGIFQAAADFWQGIRARLAVSELGGWGSP